MIFTGLSMKQIKNFFLEGESPNFICIALLRTPSVKELTESLKNLQLSSKRWTLTS